MASGEQPAGNLLMILAGHAAAQVPRTCASVGPSTQQIQSSYTSSDVFVDLLVCCIVSSVSTVMAIPNAKCALAQHLTVLHFAALFVGQVCEAVS